MTARPKFDKVVIVGLGLIGGSLALSWKETGTFKQILALTRNSATLEKAVGSGAVDGGFTQPGRWLGDVDALVLATPVGSILPMLRLCLPYLSPACHITDVGSVKQSIVEEAERLNGGSLFFLGGHPMAGSEQSGFDAARSGLFRTATYVLTPTARTPEETVLYWEHAVGQLGANILFMDADQHDRTVAWTSHLPFLVASALTRAVVGAAGESPYFTSLIAGGFRDTTRVASGEPSMGADICRFNHQAILEALQGFRASLAELESLLAENKAGGQSLQKLLQSIKLSRDSLIQEVQR